MYRLIPHNTKSVSPFETVFRNFFGESGVAWGPAVDVFETEEAFVVRADLPGVDPKNVSLSIEDGYLTLKGEKAKGEDSRREGSWYRFERRYGSFVRSIALPDTVDPENVEATAENGVLTVTLPKREETKPRTIKVNVK
jgi:HSP20 family protein